jgi:hypothetical protein
VLPFDPHHAASAVPLAEHHAAVQVMVLRLVTATVLAALIAYRPWRLLMSNVSRIATDTAQAQVIIAVAGAIMVIIIGDSVARAFGLVGLGAFIRFRSGIKDPRDAAVMFVMIGLGMAIGLGLYVVAGVVAAFIGVVVAVLDFVDRSPARKVRIGIDMDQGGHLLASFRPVFPSARVIEAPNGPAGSGRIVLEIDDADDLDASTILESLNANGVAGIRGVSLVDS